MCSSIWVLREQPPVDAGSGTEVTWLSFQAPAEVAARMKHTPVAEQVQLLAS